MAKTPSKKGREQTPNRLETNPKAKTPAKSVGSESKKTKSNYLPWLIAIGLVILTFWAFSGGFQHEFIDWDDHVYIENNYLVTQPSWASARQAFRSSVALNYHPITILTYIANSAIWGWEDATPFIVTNVLIHILNVLLVFYFIRKLTFQNLFVSSFTALLFAIHPMRVESVIWTSERKDVVYVFFFLLGAIMYLRYIDENKRKWLIYSWVLFLFSCLSKAQAVAFPVVMLLIDYWRGRAYLVKLLTEKIAFFIVALLFGLIALDIQSGGNFHGLTQTVGVQKTALDLKVFSTTSRLIYAGYGFLMYFVHLLYPVNLAGFYPYEDGTPEANQYWVGLMFFFIVAGITIFSLRKTKILGFGIGFYFFTVALVLQFISVGAAIMADRYTYLPYIGLFFVMAMLLDKWANSGASMKYMAWGVAVAFSVFCMYRTTQQVTLWYDSGTFFGQIIKLYPNDARAYTTRGRYLGLKGKIDEAISDLENAVKYGNKESGTYDNLGTGYGFKGRTQDAIKMFTKAIELGPTDGNPYRNRGLAYLSVDPAKAIVDFEKALTMKLTDAAPTRALLASAYLQTKEYTKSVTNFDQAIAEGAATANNYHNRGVAKLQMGDREGCITDLKKALELNYEPARKQLESLGVK